MSLEEAIRENTEAVKALTAAMKGGAGAKASAADAAIEKEAARATGAKASGGEPAASSKKKAVTLDTIKERFGGYLGVEDKAVRKARIAQVQQIVDHFGVGKASELDEANWQEALDFLTAFENGEEPDFGDGEGEGDGDESLV